MDQTGDDRCVDARFLKLWWKVQRTKDARDLGPYFLHIQKLVAAPPPIETMHEITDYDE
jgi:hypothetical protein